MQNLNSNFNTIKTAHRVLFIYFNDYYLFPLQFKPETFNKQIDCEFIKHNITRKL